MLFALDHADPKMLEILRDHPCIPVAPAHTRRLKKPNKLVLPRGLCAALYSESDERFPCGSEETYLRADRLQVLKMLGMKCPSGGGGAVCKGNDSQSSSSSAAQASPSSSLLTWAELVDRAESVENDPDDESPTPWKSTLTPRTTLLTKSLRPWRSTMNM